MDYHDVVDELESAEQELGLAACDVDETEGAGLDLAGMAAELAERAEPTGAGRPGAPPAEAWDGADAAVWSARRADGLADAERAEGLPEADWQQGRRISLARCAQ
ncbi:hypothetical protein DMB38_06065 [Streptomyces sp. WAC 06738]|uniref:hypothetical protein n=1 Tax=Streptomyces sp. WAC 06738 TaxID=2203210 RepID=UPI000F6C72B1|nr:hypothetical protein [Streptomyces sp. WAC 06738]AZM45449.1 hypothetical protein DMB38_06065 [Streptomyces sp. WAC 06738]